MSPKKAKLFFLAPLVIILSIVVIFIKPKIAARYITVENPELVNFSHPQIPHITTSQRPQLQAGNYILVDVKTNNILLSKNISDKIYPASTTKLVTALTSLNIYPLDDTVSIGSTYSEGKIMNLTYGEKITVRSLVTALLVYSANDSAYTLASNHQDGVSGFVSEMNQLVAKYGLKNTHFTNFDGIHSTAHYSTVYDLAEIGRLAIQNSIIRDTVKNKQLTVFDISGKISHPLTTTNELLGVIPEIEGLKTGWTPEAGGCFVSLININGHELIGVVAQSVDRFADTRTIVDWAKANIVWQPYNP